MWDNKDQICQESGKLIVPSQAGGSLFNIYDSHSLGEIALKGWQTLGLTLLKKVLQKLSNQIMQKRK